MIDNDKYILGISAFFHDSAAVLLKGNEILAAVQEERFTRLKADSSFPTNSIKYCLSFLPDNRPLDAVVFSENPILKLDRMLKQSIDNFPKGAPIFSRLIKTTNVLNNKLPSYLVDLLNDPNEIYFCNHHLSHAASAFIPAELKESAILIVDGVGEWATTSIFRGDCNGITLLKEIRYPHSLGLFYSAFTQYCGFKVNSGEYKLMGLAPFGRPRFRNLIYEKIINVKKDGSFQLNLDYFSFKTDNTTINPLFCQLFERQTRHPSEPITQFYRDVAASAQAVVEEVMTKLARTALALTGSNNLCLAGGVALNCVSNSKIINNISELKNIWIQPASGDAGGALGAALYVGKNKFHIENYSMSPYYGPEFSSDEIKNVLDSAGVVYHQIDNEVLYFKTICDQLSKQGVIGFFSGRMEFGPRALGNRSILADPRSCSALRKTNMKIKFREPWRPFAPSILESEASNYFEQSYPSPYMLHVSKIKELFRKNVNLSSIQNKEVPLTKIMNQSFSSFPAISHCDYSSRLQTVNESNDKYFRLLKYFFDLTGCPMLLNTSFNVRGEPIVCSPIDALNCFFNTHMDLLAIGSFVLIKSEQSTKLKSRLGKVKFNAD